MNIGGEEHVRQFPSLPMAPELQIGFVKINFGVMPDFMAPRNKTYH
jgi:hypothetical protein